MIPIRNGWIVRAGQSLPTFPMLADGSTVFKELIARGTSCRKTRKGCRHGHHVLLRYLINAEKKIVRDFVGHFRDLSFREGYH